MNDSDAKILDFLLAINEQLRDENNQLKIQIKTLTLKCEELSNAISAISNNVERLDARTSPIF